MSGLLVINRSDSRCGECGKPCDPHAKAHDVLLGWGPTNGDPGCGAEWDRVGSDYAGPDMEAAVRRMRPDLTWDPAWPGARRA